MNTTITPFRPGLREGDPDDKLTLGGKGAGLIGMCHAGLPVPPGFVIHADCCRHVLTHDGAWPDGLEPDLRTAMAELEQATGRRFGDAQSPLLVSVRSGAAVSMPGMMDTLLNCGLQPATDGANPPGFWRVYAQFTRMFAVTVADIPDDAFDHDIEAQTAACGHPLPEWDEEAHAALAKRYAQRYAVKTGFPMPDSPWATLTACINAVFRSWSSDRCVAYRRQNGIEGLPGTAVTIQAMFPSQCSGIVFTISPNTLDDALIIEASYGLGESVVSGDVKPDSFTVERESLEIRTRTLGSKASSVRALGDNSTHDPALPSLDEAQIRELAELALKVEAFAGVPVDLEWGLADGNFSLLQWRPIRGIEVLRDIETGRQETIERLRAMAGDSHKVWVRHNLGETLPHSTPLTWAVMRRFMSGNGGFGKMYRDFGYRPGRTVREEGFLELICGGIYADADRTAGLFWEGMPLTYDIEAVVRDPNALQAPPTRFDADRTDATFLLRLPGTILAMIRSSRKMKRLRARAAETFDKHIVPDFLDYVGTEWRRDLGAMETADLFALFASRRQRVLDDFGGESLKPGFFGGLACASLEATLKQILGPRLGEQTTLELISGLDGDLTLDQDQQLYEVAHGRASMADFITSYGHRAVGEMELSSPRWREDTAYLDRLMALHQREGEQAPMAMHDANRQRRRDAEQRLPALLAEHGAASLEPDLRRDLTDAQRLLPYRENGKHYLMMGYELLRTLCLELGRRWAIGNDIFYLEPEEWPRFETEREQLLATVAQRRTRREAMRRLELAEVIDSHHLEQLGQPKVYDAAQELEGEAVSAGIFTGPVRIVRDPGETRDLGRGYVLVCPSTDPAWTVLFMDAGAVVMERGGVLSHGAIVARDFGIPALVCPDVTHRLDEGARIRVDGNTGRITVLDAVNADSEGEH